MIHLFVLSFILWIFYFQTEFNSPLKFHYFFTSIPKFHGILFTNFGDQTASQTWTLTNRDRKQSNFFERNVYIRIVGPVYDNEKENYRVLTNKEIYAKVKKKTYYNRDNNFNPLPANVENMVSSE